MATTAQKREVRRLRTQADSLATFTVGRMLPVLRRRGALAQPTDIRAIVAQLDAAAVVIGALREEADWVESNSI